VFSKNFLHKPEIDVKYVTNFRYLVTETAEADDAGLSHAYAYIVANTESIILPEHKTIICTLYPAYRK
jgi:hypothetical protein